MDLLLEVLTEAKHELSGERYEELHGDGDGVDGEAGKQFGEAGVIGAEVAEDAGAEHPMRETAEHVAAVGGQVLRLVQVEREVMVVVVPQLEVSEPLTSVSQTQHTQCKSYFN